jgi:uncharacterized membrane protein
MSNITKEDVIEHLKIFWTGVKIVVPMLIAASIVVLGILYTTFFLPVVGVIVLLFIIYLIGLNSLSQRDGDDDNEEDMEYPG